MEYLRPETRVRKNTKGFLFVTARISSINMTIAIQTGNCLAACPPLKECREAREEWIKNKQSK